MSLAIGGLVVTGCVGSPSETDAEPTASASGPSVKSSADAISPCSHPRNPEVEDVHCIDWLNSKIPGAVCGLEGDVQLKDGHAKVESDRWPHYATVNLSVSVVDAYGSSTVAYGDLDGDGEDEAGIESWCDNGGGTAPDGQLGEQWVIFTSRGNVRALGSVLPPKAARDAYISFVERILIAPGEVVALNAFYGDHDGTRPSGRSMTTWSYKGNSLVAEDTTVLVLPE